MRHFLVEVHPHKTEVREFARPLGQVETKKLVDGEEFNYSMIAAKPVHENDTLWKARGRIQIDYHALNGCVFIGRLDFSKNKRIGDIVTLERRHLICEW